MAAFYHGSIRSLLTSFGSYFSKLHIIRRKGDSVRGEITQDILVPIAYGPRSKWWDDLTKVTRDKQVKLTLPRIAFEINGFSYDSSRKSSRSQKIKCVDESGTTMTVGSPVPWNLDITMYIVSDNQEDCFQVVEQILPQFNPDITMNITGPFGQTITVPISLTSVNLQDEFEGALTDDRLVQCILTFTVKMSFYGEIKTGGVIEGIDSSINTGQDVGTKTDQWDKITGTFDEGKLEWKYGDTAADKNPQKDKSPEVRVFEVYNNKNWREGVDLGRGTN